MAIEHPKYYTDKKIEVIDYIKDTLTEDEYIGFCIGNVMKYISRWRKKGGSEDLRKALYYMKEAVEVTRDDTEYTFDNLRESVQNIKNSVIARVLNKALLEKRKTEKLVK